jgi:long-chain acyl-CoA synthetase
VRILAASQSPPLVVPGSVLTVDGLRQHLLNVLPTFKVPKYLALTDNPLPRNASEKIHRLALRDSFVAN